MLERARKQQRKKRKRKENRGIWIFVATCHRLPVQKKSGAVSAPASRAYARRGTIWKAEASRVRPPSAHDVQRTRSEDHHIGFTDRVRRVPLQYTGPYTTTRAGGIGRLKIKRGRSPAAPQSA